MIKNTKNYINKNILFATGSLVLVASNVNAALHYIDLSTDSAGAFGDPGTGWVDGTGLVGGVGSAVGAAGSTVSGNNQILDGVRKGELLLGAVGGYIDGPRNGVNAAGVTASVSIDIGSSTSNGTGDLYISGATPGAAFPIGILNLSVINLTNANSLTMTINFSSRLATMDGNSTFAPGGLPTDFVAANGAPFLGATRIATGSSAYNLGLDYLGLVSSTDGVTFQNGLIAGSTALEMSATSLVFADGATSASQTGITAGTSWQGVNGFDVTPGDGLSIGRQGDSSIQDAEKVYASGIQFTFTRTDGMNFDATDEFVFSTNGNVWSDTSAAAASPVPEPSSSALVSLALIGTALRRKR